MLALLRQLSPVFLCIVTTKRGGAWHRGLGTYIPVCNSILEKKNKKDKKNDSYVCTEVAITLARGDQHSIATCLVLPSMLYASAARVLTQ